MPGKWCRLDPCVEDATWRGEVRALAEEIRHLANADVAARWYPVHLEAGDVDRVLAQAEDIPLYIPPPLADRRAGRAIQDRLWLAPLRQARQLNMSCPTLERLAIDLMDSSAG